MEDQARIERAIRTLDALIDVGRPHTVDWYQLIERRNSLTVYLAARWPQ